jgi:hypothetical protein
MNPRGAFMAVALVLSHAVSAAAQCAMCRTALGGLDAKLSAAFQSGVLFLFAAPFTVFGAVAFLAVRDAKRRRRPDLPP